jgi:hypothetical protein
MKPPTRTLAATLAALAAYTAIAWLVSAIDIPPGTPTARAPWVRPFRVLATLGFAIASAVRIPHVAGQLLAAIALGAVVGAVFAGVRQVLR